MNSLRRCPRRGARPAFWLISTSGWSPEIDIHEGFVFESWWDFDRYTANTLHGGAKITRTFRQGTFMNTDEVYGIGGFTTGFQSFAGDIGPITSPGSSTVGRSVRQWNPLPGSTRIRS